VLSYDAAHGKVVLFGGAPESGDVFDDTWTWDGSTWAEETPATSPPGRLYSALSYDVARGELILFGGADSSDLLGDTWRWDGSTWTEVAPETTPPARYGHALAYDAARLELVLFGGQGNDFWERANANPISRSDTWVLRYTRTRGSECTDDAQCASGECVDGVCCESACGGGLVDDCVACAAALTGAADGVCAPLDTPSCEPVADAGVADASVADAGVGGGPRGGVVGGACGCDLTGRARTGGLWTSLVAGLVAYLIARRRARRGHEAS
jgi:hypothetical protein